MFCDCPPSISRLSENVFRAADALLVPLIPTTLSIRSLDQLAGFLARCGRPAPRLMPFFSMVDQRKNLHKEVVSDYRAARLGVLATSIPSASAVEAMGVHQAPVAAFAPASTPAVRAYRALWEDIKAALA